MTDVSASRRDSGYSLLEILIALSIVAIVISLAIPSWREQVMKARRFEAVVMLTQLANRQEHFRLQHSRYADNKEISLAPPAGLGMSTQHAYYALEVTTTELSFSATLRGIGSQASDNTCRLLQLDSEGIRRAQGHSGDDTTTKCWQN